MISSSSPPLERGLDTMVLVYSLLQGHPAALPSEQFLRAHSGWFTTPAVLFEARNILTKVYSVLPADATRKLTLFAAGPIVLLDLDPAATVSVLHLADTHAIDLTDAILLHLAHQQGAGSLAREDRQLAHACGQFGITAETPLDAALRQQVAAWESAHLAPKGLARVLRRVHHW